MKKYNRRRLLLFISQLGATLILGSSSNCETRNKHKEMESLKEETLKYLNSGKEIKLKWECGGDQAIIYTFIDGERINFRDKFAEQLDIYLINYLNLPDVGEFELDGEGKLIEEDGEVYLECESIMRGFAGEKEGEWIELNEKEEEWSGKKELFK